MAAETLRYRLLLLTIQGGRCMHHTYTALMYAVHPVHKFAGRHCNTSYMMVHWMLCSIWCAHLAQLPQSLPNVAQLQRLVRDLPLKSVDAQRLRHSLYPDGCFPGGLYLRVLQVKPMTP
jgi:hypothetical protein